MSERILVAGATGFIGGRLAADLARAGYRVTALGRYDPRPAHVAWSDAMDQLILGDIRDQRIIDRLVAEDFDAIINLVSLGANQDAVEPAVAFAIDVLPTWNLLKRLAQSRLRRFIYFSSQRVFDGLGAAPIDEQSAVAPTTQYGLTHVLSEQVAAYFNRTTGIDAINARLSSCYGSPAFRNGNWRGPIINGMCCMAVDDGHIQLRSDGLAHRDFIHIREVCRFVRGVLRADRLTASHYHIASGQTASVLGVAHRIAERYRARSGRDVRVLLPDRQISTGPPSGEPADAQAFSSAGARLIGREPATTLDEGIDEVLDYLDTSSGYP